MIIKGARYNIGFLLTLQQELLPLLDEKEKNRNSSFYDTGKAEALEQKKQEAAEILFEIIKEATFQENDNFVDIVNKKSYSWTQDFLDFASKNFSKHPCYEAYRLIDMNRGMKAIPPRLTSL